MVSDSPDSQDLDSQELYVVVRKAVEDGILSAVGSIVLAVLSFGLIWFGMVIGAPAIGENLIQAAGGAFMVLVGLYFAGTSLGVFPSLQESVNGTDRNR